MDKGAEKAKQNDWTSGAMAPQRKRSKVEASQHHRGESKQSLGVLIRPIKLD